jgi:hypothetical protein
MRLFLLSYKATLIPLHKELLRHWQTPLFTLELLVVPALLSHSVRRRPKVTFRFLYQLTLQKCFEFHCRDCGSGGGYSSRPRTFSERFILPLLLLKPVRCAECFRRDYCLRFTPVNNRPTEKLKVATSPQRTSNVA